jgi:hypothetical protein
MKATEWASVILKFGIVASVAYIMFDMVKLPAEIRGQLEPLTPLAQSIGGICHNDGDGEWIQGMVKSDGERAVSAALSELIPLREPKLSGCAISLARKLKMKGVQPSLEKIAGEPTHPSNAFARELLNEFQR